MYLNISEFTAIELSDMLYDVTDMYRIIAQHINTDRDFEIEAIDDETIEVVFL